jgi:hypothetical protein
MTIAQVALKGVRRSCERLMTYKIVCKFRIRKEQTL